MADFREQSTDAAVKVGAVAPTATDNALVVALSPNAVALIVGPIGSGGSSTAAPVTIGGVDAGNVVRHYAPVAKGIQAGFALPTQDLKDSGRVNVAITCYQAAGIVTTEALFAAAAFSISRDGAAATTAQQFTVTAGKRFVLQSLVVSVKNTAAAAGASKLVMRYSAAGGVIASTSPILAILDLGSNSVTANAYIGPTEMALPDGVELLGGSTLGFTNLSSAATMLHTITANGFEY